MFKDNRDWCARLCTPLQDGTWLIQAPITAAEGPLLYILPNAVTKDRYLAWAAAFMCLKSFNRVVLFPFLTLWPAVLGMWQLTFGIMSIGPILGVCLLMVLSAAVINIALEWRFFGWVAGLAVKPAPGWQRPKVVMRTGAEWEDFYRSHPFPAARWMEAGLLGVVGMVGLVSVAGYLNMCHGIGVLDAVFDDVAHRARYVASCEQSPWLVFVSVAVMVLTVVMMVRRGQHRRSGVSHLPAALRTLQRLADLVARRRSS